MQSKPNKWLAFTLGLLLQPIGMLYVAKPRWALFYFVATVIVGVSELWLRLSGKAPALQYFSFNWVIIVGCAIHAYRIAKVAQPSPDRPWYSRWYGLVAICSLTVLAVVSFRAFLYEPFRLPSRSMEPSLSVGAYIVVTKWGYGNYRTYGIPIVTAAPSAPIHRGDIFVYQYPGDPSLDYVGRIVGLPGDVISYRSKQLAVNGVRAQTGVALAGDEFDILDERLGSAAWIVKTLKEAPIKDYEGTVPAHQYFVLGDNRDNSFDSRYWGFVPAQNLVGRVAYHF